MTCRNRLAVTCKAITALKKHSVLPHQLFVYDNLTSYKVPEHFLYWAMLYEKGLITQVTFNTKESTFGAFSKATACNMFGLQHESDPQKDKYDFLVFIVKIRINPTKGVKSLNLWDKINYASLLCYLRILAKAVMS